MAIDFLMPAVAAMLLTIGRSSDSFSLNSISASGNNRVFTLNCDGEMFVLKWYFNDVTDRRDRIGAEFAFLEHAWRMGIRCIPEPLCKDLNNQLALFEFVEGCKLNANQVDGSSIKQATEFLVLLNSSESRATATSLPNASEACFSLEEHFALVDKRLSYLGNLPVGSDVDSAAAKLVSRINNYWKSAKARLLKGYAELNVSPEVAIKTSDRCLSPSDFGFHNALAKSDGSFCFIDFEYAGWDDPAKTVCDFFSHPGVEVSHEYFEPFLAQFLAPFENAQQMAERVRLLEPISQVKWCCIILNEFLPTLARRRNFANPVANAIISKNIQLQKATKLFETLAR